MIFIITSFFQFLYDMKYLGYLSPCLETDELCCVNLSDVRWKLLNPKVWTVDRTVHVELKRSLRMTEATWLREELFPYFEQAYCRFSFDFTEIESIDSSGFGILLAIRKKAKEQGGGIRIYGLRHEFEARFDFSSLFED